MGLIMVLLPACSSSSVSPQTPATPTSSDIPLGDLATLGTLVSPSPAPIGPESIPLVPPPPLGDLGHAATGQTVDGIHCQTSEQVAYHIHAHLAIYVHGQPRQVPFGIGIPNPVIQNVNGNAFVISGKCFYWLHTHVADGVLHVESPSERIFRLGEFFDLWGQPLSALQVGPVTGTVTALYDGQPYMGDPRAIPLTPHADIQLDVGSPLVAPEKTNFGKL